MTSNAFITLDPWLDAKPISQRLRTSGALLTVGIGAEAWCERCVELRSVFEMSMQEHETRLWLDMDEHAELLGDFVPTDLPMVLQWQEGRLVRIAILEGVLDGVEDVAETGVPTARLRELALDTEHPNLWLVLTNENWAQ
jgi:hypothetical protein